MRRKGSFGRKVAYAAIIVTGVYLILGLGLTLAQRKLLYFPCKSSTASSQTVAAHYDFEAWRDSTGQFIGWKRLSRSAPAQGQVLVLHGNAGCALDRIMYADALQRSASFDVYLLEYPGYDGRRGSPSEATLFAAAAAGLGQMNTACEVFLIGESLGTGVAAYLAGTHPKRITGVLLIAPYNNLTAVAQHHLPIFPARLMLWDKYRSDHYLKSYHGPLAMLLAGRDDVIPSEFGRRLFQQYAGPKRLWESPEADHDGVAQAKPQFWREVIEFWEQRDGDDKQNNETTDGHGAQSRNQFGTRK